jgi:hypothetical protein
MAKAPQQAIFATTLNPKVDYLLDFLNQFFA